MWAILPERLAGFFGQEIATFSRPRDPDPAGSLH